MNRLENDKKEIISDKQIQIVEPRSGRTGYAGASSWFPGRERQGDKQKGDRNTNYQVIGKLRFPDKMISFRATEEAASRTTNAASGEIRLILSVMECLMIN